MTKFIKILSLTITFLILATTLSYATDINMNLQGSDYSNSVPTNTQSHSSTTIVQGQNSNVSAVESSEGLTTSDIINILLIVVGIVLILLGIAILIRISMMKKI